MTATYFFYNYARTAATATHPNWSRQSDTIVRLPAIEATRSSAGDAGWDVAAGEPTKVFRRTATVPGHNTNADYLNVYLERGLYILRNLSTTATDILRIRLVDLAATYDTDPARTFRLFDEDLFGVNGNTKFTAEDTANPANPSTVTGFVAETAVPAGTKQHHFLAAGAFMPIWVPKKIIKIGIANDASAVANSIAVENHGTF